MNAKQTKTIIMTAIAIVVLLVVLNIAMSNYVSLVIVMGATFLAGRYTSKEFGGEFSKEKFEASLSSVEKKVDHSIQKATESMKDTVEDIKEQIEDVTTSPTVTKKIPTPARKTPIKRVSVKKPVKKTTTTPSKQ